MKLFVYTLMTLVGVLSTLATGSRGSTTVTLYDVEFQDQTGLPDLSISDRISLSVSAVSTISNGGTVYEEVFAVTEQVVQNSFSTSTIVPTSISTGTATFVQGASYEVGTITSQDGTAFVESCSFQGTTKAGCVGIVQYATAGSVTATSTVFSLTGVPTPAFTLIELSSSGTTSTRRAGGLSFGAFISLMAVLATWGSALWV